MLLKLIFSILLFWYEFFFTKLVLVRDLKELIIPVLKNHLNLKDMNGIEFVENI